MRTSRIFRNSRRAVALRARYSLLCLTVFHRLVGKTIAQAPKPLRHRSEPDTLVYAPTPLPVPGGAASCQPTFTGFPPTMLTVSKSQPRSVESFVESLKGNDAAIEVAVGQGRLLTLKQDISAPNKPRALVAVGDATTVDFALMGPRHLRPIGQRIGTTDLSITMSDDVTFSFQVDVIANLKVLAARLKAMFRDATCKLGQVRDYLIEQGQARDATQVTQICRTVGQGWELIGRSGPRG